MPHMARATPTIPMGTPTRSRGPRAVVSFDSGTSRVAATTTRAPIGTLMRKISRQSDASINRAPTEGPNAAPNAPIAPQTPIATPRFARGNWGSTMAREAGVNSAPPTACTTRAAINAPALGASPHSADPTRNPTTPVMNMRRRPRRSASRPDSSSSDASAML
jgi:hypothetical protein